MESRLGHDFGRVRVHTGRDAARSAAELGANAYTLGLNVYFGAGRYRPDHPQGQRLITHELQHVARAGPTGPVIPRLDPQSPEPSHEEKLRELLTAKPFSEKAFKKYLAAHPDSIEAAERLLVGGVIGRKTAIKLLKGIMAKDPGSESRIAAQVHETTHDARTRASEKTLSMWDNYMAAAFAYAVVQWADARSKAEKKKRPKPAKGEKSEPTALERQYETWLAEAKARFDGLAGQRKSLLRESDAAIGEMMAAAEPVPLVQADILELLSVTIQQDVDVARLTRLHTHGDLELLALKPTPWVEKQLKKAEKDLGSAQEQEKKARELRESLEAASSESTSASAPAGPSSAPAKGKKKAPLTPLESAREAEKKAIAKREKAEKALTPEGATDPAVQAYLESQVPEIRQEAEERLQDAAPIRDEKLAEFLPTEAQEEGVDLAAILSEDERWWIYHTALSNIGSGFPGYSHESSIVSLVVQRSLVAGNRSALGLEILSIGTYSGHGEGQYDVHAPGGLEIQANASDVIDLTRTLGALSDSTAPRLFERIDSQVWSAKEISATAADEDVLQKLAYGFFGRGWEPKRIEAYVSGAASSGKRAPDSSRVLAALTFENTIAGSSVSASVRTARDEIRDLLETGLASELAALSPAVVIPAGKKILQDVDASGEHPSIPGKKVFFGSTNMITQDAYDAFAAVPGASGKKPPYGKDRGKASKALFKAADHILLTDPTIIDKVETLMRDLWKTKSGGLRGGPTVTLIHHYKEIGTGKDVWVWVAYRHLREVSVEKKTPITPGDLIGTVGSSGNAISPHIHMEVRVYEKKPKSEKDIPIGFLPPVEFFPFERPKPAPAATPPATTQPASQPASQPTSLP